MASRQRGRSRRPVDSVEVTPERLLGDRHADAKHNRADRAVSLFDVEILRQLIDEGFAHQPGVAGENVTVEGLDLQRVRPGDELQIGDVVLRLEQLRKRCYVLVPCLVTSYPN